MTLLQQNIGDIFNAPAVDRLAAQYQQSDKFRKWVNLYMNESSYLCAGICSISRLFDIESASGVWLDVLGRIVGQPRAALDTSSLKIFTMNPTAAADEGFNEGVFTDGVYGTVTVDASDVVYRRMIKARALKNATLGSVNDVVKGVVILTGGRTDFVLDDMATPMQFGITFANPLDETSRILLEQYDLLARPLGVALTAVVD